MNDGERGEDFWRGFIEMGAAEYHADPCPSPSLSSHAAHTFVGRCAAHAYHRHPALGGVPMKVSKSMAQGGLIHTLMLGKGHEQIQAVEAKDWRTNAAKAARDEIEASGKTAVLVGDVKRARAVSDRFAQRLREEDGIVLDGESEQAVFWVETADDGTEVQCRCMIDHLKLSGDGCDIFDLKTCESAHPRPVSAHIHGYGYHVQAVANVRAVQSARPDLAGKIRFFWPFLEIPEPHLVQLYEPNPSLEELGFLLWRQAVNGWAKCLREDRWPRYSDGVIGVEASQRDLESAYMQEGDHEGA